MGIEKVTFKDFNNETINTFTFLAAFEKDTISDIELKKVGLAIQRAQLDRDQSIIFRKIYAIKNNICTLVIERLSENKSLTSSLEIYPNLNLPSYINFKNISVTTEPGEYQLDLCRLDIINNLDENNFYNTALQAPFKLAFTKLSQPRVLSEERANALFPNIARVLDELTKLKEQKQTTFNKMQIIIERKINNKILCQRLAKYINPENEFASLIKPQKEKLQNLIRIIKDENRQIERLRKKFRELYYFIDEHLKKIKESRNHFLLKIKGDAAKALHNSALECWIRLLYDFNNHPSLGKIEEFNRVFMEIASINYDVEATISNKIFFNSNIINKNLTELKILIEGTFTKCQNESTSPWTFLTPVSNLLSPISNLLIPIFNVVYGTIYLLHPDWFHILAKHLKILEASQPERPLITIQEGSVSWDKAIEELEKHVDCDITILKQDCDDLNTQLDSLIPKESLEAPANSLSQETERLIKNLQEMKKLSNTIRPQVHESILFFNNYIKQLYSKIRQESASLLKEAKSLQIPIDYDLAELKNNFADLEENVKDITAKFNHIFPKIRIESPKIEDAQRTYSETQAVLEKYEENKIEFNALCGEAGKITLAHYRLQSEIQQKKRENQLLDIFEIIKNALKDTAFWHKNTTHLFCIGGKRPANQDNTVPCGIAYMIRTLEEEIAGKDLTADLAKETLTKLKLIAVRANLRKNSLFSFRKSATQLFYDTFANFNVEQPDDNHLTGITTILKAINKRWANLPSKNIVFIPSKRLGHKR